MRRFPDARRQAVNCDDRARIKCTVAVTPQNKVAGLRRFGAASLDMAFVATGRLDGYWERNLQAWEIAAGQTVVRQAGGIVSGIEGHDNALTTRNVVCGNEFVHAESVKILKPLG